jgi:bifunctional non-homologous end joining protein LigD
LSRNLPPPHVGGCKLTETPLASLPAEPPRFVEPMKARLHAELPADHHWLFEVKLDGIRAIATKEGERVQLFSRRPRELTAEYPQLVEALRRLPMKRWAVDGEIVALDEQGRSSFQVLQNRQRASARPPVILFYLFDLLNLNGRDLKAMPLIQRKQVLEELLKGTGTAGPIRLSPVLEGRAAQIWKEVLRHGFEGVIAKQKDSVYEPGRRSGAWLKIKTHAEQEFVIGGYTPPAGARKFFGAIIVGYYSGHDLIFASRVGTGFDFGTLRSLHQLFQPLRTAACPFANLPTQRAGRFGQGLTASEMKRCVWLKPKLVCQVRFMEWTRDGNLRQPVFVALREDKPPGQVVRETTQ